MLTFCRRCALNFQHYRSGMYRQCETFSIGSRSSPRIQPSVSTKSVSIVPLRYLISDLVKTIYVQCLTFSLIHCETKKTIYYTMPRSKTIRGKKPMSRRKKLKRTTKTHTNWERECQRK